MAFACCHRIKIRVYCPSTHPIINIFYYSIIKKFPYCITVLVKDLIVTVIVTNNSISCFGNEFIARRVSAGSKKQNGGMHLHLFSLFSPSRFEFGSMLNHCSRKLPFSMPCQVFRICYPNSKLITVRLWFCHLL